MFQRRNADQELEYFLMPQNGSLALAWRRLLSSTIKDTKDRLGLKIFAAMTAEHLEILRGNLQEKLYSPSPPSFMYGPKDNKTIRVRTFLSIPDRIVYMAIGNIIVENCYADLAPYASNSIYAHIPAPKNWDGSYSDFTFCRTFSNGTQIGQYDKFLDAVYGDIQAGAKHPDMWMLETDVTAFYPSLDHNSICEMLQRRGWLKNFDLLRLLRDCLSRWTSLGDDIALGQGVPIGYETSELLATLYLLDVDLEMKNTAVKIRRFVDDTYVFAEGRTEVVSYLARYDLALQMKGLNLNQRKTKIEKCSDVDVLNKAKFEYEVRKKPSYIRNVLEERLDDVAKQEELQKLYKEYVNCLGLCDKQDILCLQENAALLAFVLYRFEEKNEALKNIALCMLDELPSRSFHVTRYLTLFSNDDFLLEKLYQVAEKQITYPASQIDSARAIIALTNGMPQRLASLLELWIENSADWYLRDAAIDMLAENLQCRSYLLDFAQREKHYLTRSKALYQCFQQSVSETEQSEVINLALCDENYTVKTLGIYLYRREASIPKTLVQRVCLPDNLRQLLRDTDDWKEYENFSLLFESVFDIEFYPNVPLVEMVPSIPLATQSLLNLQDANSDPLEFTKALHDFALQFFVAFIRLEYPPYSASTLREILLEIHQEGNNYTDISKLRDAKEEADLGRRSKGDYKRKVDNFNNVKRIIAFDLAFHYEICRRELPIKLHQFILGMIRQSEGTMNQNDVNPAVLIPFLIEIARFAKDELKEIWRLRRNQRKVNLSSTNETDTDTQEILADARTELGDEYTQLVTLIQGYRQIIYQSRRAKQLNQMEYSEQRITRAALEQRNEAEDRTIQTALAEAKSELSKLGNLQVEKLESV